MIVYIREAVPGDNEELQRLQSQSPMGTTLIVSTVNTPDFFARARAYPWWQVFVACMGGRIVGSAACGIREGLVGDAIVRIGYEFQYVTHPDYRRQGVASQLHEHIEGQLGRQNVALSYCLVMEGNSPSMRLFEGQGFEHHRTLVMPGLAVYREMDQAPEGRVRSATPADLDRAAGLLNDTWRGHELHEPMSAHSLAQFIARTPAYELDSLLVLEDRRGEMLACLGFWEWSQVTRVVVRALSLKMRAMNLLLDAVRLARPMPRGPRPSSVLKQVVLTPIGFRDPRHLGVLLRRVNNQVLHRGIEQIFCICEQDHTLLRSMSGFIRVDTAMHVYTKPLQQHAVLGNGPISIDGIDL